MSDPEQLLFAPTLDRSKI